MEMKTSEALSDRVIEGLAALANGHRLAVFRALVRAGATGLPAGTIAQKLGLPPSSLSFHLSHLRQAGLVRDERVGRSIIYRADFSAMASLVSYLLEECCADDDTLENCGLAKELQK